MKGLTTYELTIADKVEGMAVPDLSDAIWGRVEAALDVEMPVKKPFYKKPAVWIVGAAIIVALFYPAEEKKIMPPVTPVIVPKKDTVKKEEFKPPARVKPVSVKKPDSAYKLPVVLVPDSLWLAPPPEPIVPPVENKPQPKRYGVQLSDSDYRFKIKPKNE